MRSVWQQMPVLLLVWNPPSCIQPRLLPSSPSPLPTLVPMLEELLPQFLDLHQRRQHLELERPVEFPMRMESVALLSQPTTKKKSAEDSNKSSCKRTKV